MEIEQKLPKSPNFGIVVGLFCATLLVFFVLALIFIRFDGKHLTLRHHSRHPTSQLVLPGAGQTSPEATLA
jgi:hypothetical protein